MVWIEPTQGRVKVADSFNKIRGIPRLAENLFAPQKKKRNLRHGFSRLVSAYPLVTMHPIYRTDLPLLSRQAPCILYIGQDVPLLPRQAPCILYIGQTYRYSPDRHHASYIQDRRTDPPQIGTMNPIYRRDVPLLHRQAPCRQTYRSSPQYTFCIFSQQVYLIIFLHFLSPSSFIPLTKCRVFPNVTLLGS